MATKVILNGVVRPQHAVSPTNSNRSVLSMFVPVDELRKLDETLIPWVNPRIGYTDSVGADKSRVRKDIRESVETKDGKFHERHLGVQLVANSARADEGTAVIDFGMSANRGLGNGGTTVRVITAMLNEPLPFVQSKDPSKKQYVKVSVFCGDYNRDDVSDLVEGWNTSLQVDAFSMANHRNAFEPFKEVLDGLKFPTVSYFFGDDGEIDVEQVLQLACVFAMDSARAAYAGTGGCLRFFMSDEGKPRVLKVLPRIAEIFKLYETIAAESPDIHNVNANNGRGGKWMSLKINETAQHKSHLPYLGVDLDYTPSKAWLIPMLAAFRPLLDTDGKTATWLSDPIAMFRDIAVARTKKDVGLLALVIGESIDNGTLSAVGRSKTLYAALEGRVSLALNRKARSAEAR